MEHHVLLPTSGNITCLQAQWIAQGKTLAILVSKGTKNTHIGVQTFQWLNGRGITSQMVLAGTAHSVTLGKVSERVAFLKSRG